MVALGFRSEKMDTNVFFKQATIALNRDDKEFTEGYNLQQYVEILDKRDKLVTLPDWFIMPMRMSILLRGLGTLLCRDSPMQICVYWNELAQKVIDSAEEGELLSV
ncbi:hypothetical protein HMI54_006440 [Coelomomyces lativittatus]|nr:hypothetical protein HMI54_006440 [Coelomomyces lativittatus]